MRQSSFLHRPVYFRLVVLLRLYVTLLLLFATQKVLFMLFNLKYAEGLTLGDWLAVVWHGLALDSVSACYILWVPLLVLMVSFFVTIKNLRRILFPYFVLVAVLMTLVFVSDVVMYRFWGVKIDSNDLMYAAHPKEMLASVTVGSILLGVLVLVVVGWHYVRRLRRAVPEELPDSPHFAGLLLMVLVGGLMFVGIRGGWSTSVANPSYAYFSSKSFLNHAALNPLFNMMHSMPKTEDFASEFQFFDPEEVERIADDCYYIDGGLSDTLLRTERPDILLVIWEGGCSAMVDNDSVAPNLRKLAREGILFDRCYANSYRTDRGLVSIFSGWPGLTTASLIKMPDMCRKLPAFPRLLHEAGYKTSFRYGGDVDYVNMRGYLYEMGFEQVEGAESFPDSRNESRWGAPDSYLLRADNLSSQSPQFTAWLTLSSHEPWQVPMHRLDNIKRNAFAYTDSCLGALVTDLKRSSRWDNLLLVVIPDHGIPVAASHTTSSPEVSAIPMVWAGGAVARHTVVHRLMNQSDMAATLLAQLHLPIQSLIFSRNVLSASYDSCYPVALHADKNLLNYFDTVGHISFDCVSGLPTAYCRTTDTAYRFIHERVDGISRDDVRLHRLKALLQLVYRRTSELKLADK